MDKAKGGAAEKVPASKARQAAEDPLSHHVMTDISTHRQVPTMLQRTKQSCHSLWLKCCLSAFAASSRLARQNAVVNVPQLFTPGCRGDADIAEPK